MLENHVADFLLAVVSFWRRLNTPMLPKPWSLSMCEGFRVCFLSNQNVYFHNCMLCFHQHGGRWSKSWEVKMTGNRWAAGGPFSTQRRPPMLSWRVSTRIFVQSNESSSFFLLTSTGICAEVLKKKQFNVFVEFLKKPPLISGAHLALVLKTDGENLELKWLLFGTSFVSFISDV